MKTVSKVVIYYSDGTYEEVSNVLGQWKQPTYPQPPWNPTSQCSGCGLKLDGAIGYVCNNPKCPCGLGPSWSGVADGK